MTLAEELASRLAPGNRLEFGELLLSRDPDGIFEARHRLDSEAAAGSLRELVNARELRELARWGASGEYRPLKAAPTLRGGWMTRTPDPKEFLKRLDGIYPGVFATAVAYGRGEIEPVPLRRTLDRQTGMYRIAGTISDPMAGRILEELCRPGCLRRIAWTIDESISARPIEADPGVLPLICTEACTFAVSRARLLAKEANEKPAPRQAPDAV